MHKYTTGDSEAKNFFFPDCCSVVPHSMIWLKFKFDLVGIKIVHLCCNLHFSIQSYFLVMTEPDDHQLMGITEISQLYFPGINLGRVSSVLLVI